MGHTVAHIPMGRANRMGLWHHEGVMVYPSGNDAFSEDVFLDDYINFRADMLITLKDPWVLQTTYQHAINFVPYVPIDHSPVSASITSRLHTAFKVLVPSRSAQSALRRAGIENVEYLPHGVRTDIYRPLEERRKECKRLWFVPEDDFTVLIIARNQARKMIPQMLKIYKAFLDRNPDVKSHLYLWTDVSPSGTDTEGALAEGTGTVGVNLLPEIGLLGLGERVVWPDKTLIRAGIPEWLGDNYEGGWDMVKLYNACDVLLGTTGGEGFFLPGLEAQACGKPIIVTDYAASPEICAAGEIVHAEDYEILNTPGVRYVLAPIDRTADALSRVMNHGEEYYARRARAFAERFDWGIEMKRYWRPFLERSELDLRPLLTKEGTKAW
jgi:glycosyltransferase involved in cell wall biosynthesis